MIGATLIALLAITTSVLAGDLVAVKADSPPTIDGKLGDAVWERAAATVGGFVPGSAKPAAKWMSVRAATDDKQLYLAIQCQEPHPKRMRAVVKDGTADVWKDDCIELFVRTGPDALDFSQFIVNSIGAREEFHTRKGARDASLAKRIWSAAASVGTDRWTVELAIPFSLISPEPKRPPSLAVKIGREDQTGDELGLSVWPEKTVYGWKGRFGTIHFKDPNVLRNASFQNGFRIWKKRSSENFPKVFRIVQIDGERVLEIRRPHDDHAWLSQTVQFTPGRFYRLEVWAKGKGGARVFSNSKTTPRVNRSTEFAFKIRPTEEWTRYEVAVPGSWDGWGNVVVKVDPSHPQGVLWIRGIRLVHSPAPMFAGDAVRLTMNAKEAVVVKKLQVADCRMVRGFIGSPIDGSVMSQRYTGTIWEYGYPGGGSGVHYRYRNGDGLHLTFVGNPSFNAVMLRGGAVTDLYRNSDWRAGSSAGAFLASFPQAGTMSAVRFDEPVTVRQASFHDTRDGAIADVGFYRVTTRPAEPAVGTPLMMDSGQMQLPLPEGRFHPETLLTAMQERYAKDDRHAVLLSQELDDPGKTIALKRGRARHFITTPYSEESGLAGIALDCGVAFSGNNPTTIMVTVQDPLDPRLDVASVLVRATKPGPAHLVIDIPNQVLLPGSSVWITLRADRDVQLSALDDSNTLFRLIHMSPEQALPEAVHRRKLILKTLFCIMSEPRPWGRYRRMSREKFFESHRFAKRCPELFMALDQCHLLAPDDPMVRQYREWVYAHALDKEDISAVLLPDSGPGPEWAVRVRQTRMATRRVVKWWVDNRMTPNGEFGGGINDDTDLYQQFADIPSFEAIDLAVPLRAGAAQLSELLMVHSLRRGLCRDHRDTLHGYEEGINHLALMTRWFYGDPVHFERCMESAKNVAKLTTLLADGRRHFRAQVVSADDIDHPRPIGLDGHANPLLWHTGMGIVEYNRNPSLLKTLREWGDTWLGFQKPQKWATEVDVKTGKVTKFETGTAFSGGFGSQWVVFVWLARITGDSRYVAPLTGEVRQGRAFGLSQDYLEDIWDLGVLDNLDDPILKTLATRNPFANLRITGNPAEVAKACVGDPAKFGQSIGNLSSAHRFSEMVTSAEPFTDRILITHLSHLASAAYFGSSNARNKFNHCQAISWNGIGMEFAALVSDNRQDRMKVLMYNSGTEPLEVQMTVWRLGHGRYRLRIHEDTDGDHVAEKNVRNETLVLHKARKVSLSIPPRRVMALSLVQEEKFASIFSRPDLALAVSETAVSGLKLTGIVHNIGSAIAPGTTIAVLDAKGAVVAEQKLADLAPPTDLEPKRLPFSIACPTAPKAGWRVVVDPKDRIEEIYEGNNSVSLSNLR
ncbi:MAG: sugar-binding protein [Lentisphaeria bacterium]|nr:sugar-binding protein [Lentisphaeria bacterium]